MSEQLAFILPAVISVVVSTIANEVKSGMLNVENDVIVIL